MSNIRLSEDMIGKEVRLVKIINSYNPDKIGAIGSIVNYDEEDKDNMHYLVNWNFNGHEWETWPNDEEIEEVVENKDVKDNKDMTNEEIWKMLKPKMEKNGLISKANLIHVSTDYYPSNEVPITKTYTEKDVINAIATAYKSGYFRAMKGRPFKIGEKKIEEKNGGHWEPVDTKNLPKEGTRVRYSRECKDYKNCESEIVIGDTGIVGFEGLEHDWFGMKPDNPRNLYYNWLSFEGTTANCLDIWVEDDE